jgi:hypothetical protein
MNPRSFKSISAERKNYQTRGQLMHAVVSAFLSKRKTKDTSAEVVDPSSVVAPKKTLAAKANPTTTKVKSPIRATKPNITRGKGVN